MFWVNGNTSAATMTFGIIPPIGKFGQLLRRKEFQFSSEQFVTKSGGHIRVSSKYFNFFHN